MNYLLKKSDTISSICGYLFLFGIFLFAFDFITISLTINKTIELKGYQLLIGSFEKSQFSSFTFQSEFWAIYTAVVLIIGLLLSILNNKKVNAYIFLLCLAGIVGLLMLQIKFYFDYVPKNTNWKSISFNNSYWILILNYAVIGCISFIENSNPNSNQQKFDNQKSTININIITQEKEKNN